ncbi:hypothetical protein LOZ53_004188 [Ophidiomyces ophidiicola]|nr:hypothetical protein LOZ55_004524 [Ophidiomyces ophidiicola]KAI1986216.1 hypothetical protein LOZ54_003977 [Ophidiomyces ophidiicola]KAI1987225.1 hypothetical protein LOZ51_005691 [Ophidiomyces ophidiicola]KAI1987738.1 hypothetical protein LOZ53_004188 [Ophidiomyces ophidiicola]
MASPSRSELEARFPLSYPIFSKLVTTTSPEFTNSDGYVDFGLSVIGGETGSLTAVRNDLEKLELRVYRKLDAVGDRIESLEYCMDKRFKNVERRLGTVEGRLDTIEGRLDTIEGRLVTIERRMDTIEGRFNYLEGKLNNSESIRRNKTRYRLFHKIDGIAMYKHNPERGRCEWTVSIDFPKHLKALRDMGNHAKGRWTDAEKSEISLPRSELNCTIFSTKPNKADNFFTGNTLQRESLRKIERLASFYNVVILNDNQSETDATEVNLHPANVDDFLEGLADEWGLEWYDIMQISNDEPNVLAGKKRGAKFWEERNVRARAG